MILSTVARLLTASVLLSLTSFAAADDWPEWRGPRRDGVWREDGIVATLPEKLPIKWRREIGSGYAGPAVAGGRVYVTDRVLKEGERNPDNPFDKSAVQGVERVLCLDAETGKIAWFHEYPSRYEISYPAGPRATPTVDGDRVFTVGVMGHLHCLDASSGDVVWRRQYEMDFETTINTWGMSAAPLFDGERLIALVGGKKGAGVVAFEKTSGNELWRALDLEDPGYSPPEIIEAGGTRQLIVWTPKHVWSLAPESGEVHWSVPFAVESALSVASPVYQSETRRLLVSSFYNGSVQLRLDESKPAAEVIWRGKSSSERTTDGLHALMCTPYVEDGFIYGVCSYGQLRCLDAATGKRRWETLAATGEGRWWNAFLVRHGEKTIICNEQGDIIFARLSSDGYEELSRTKLIEPTNPIQRRMTVWSHPAFANRSVYARNDKEIICADLAAGK